MKIIWNCYSRGIKGGGAIAESTTSGGGFYKSTENGGGTWVTAAIGNTYAAGAQGTYKVGNEIVSGNIIVSGYTMSTSLAQSTGSHQHGSAGSHAHDSAGSHDHGGTTHPGPGDHEHSIWAHGQHQHPSAGSHQHSNAGNHTHDMYHHGHFITHEHEIAIPDHSHDVDVENHTHEIELPDHGHEIEFGIFEGPTPTAVTVKVDGNEIPDAPLSAEALDIVDYLKKDESGKIVRGWHEIEFIPNGLGRVEASLHIQLFIQSRGGGDY